MTERYSNKKIFELVIAKPQEFTPRQLEILESVIEGKSNKEIADEIGITIKSVKNYMSGLGSGDRSRKGLFGIAADGDFDRKRFSRNGMIWRMLERGILKLEPIVND